jgi:hypothetical protein
MLDSQIDFIYELILYYPQVPTWRNIMYYRGMKTKNTQIHNRELVTGISFELNSVAWFACKASSRLRHRNRSPPLPSFLWMHIDSTSISKMQYNTKENQPCQLLLAQGQTNAPDLCGEREIPLIATCPPVIKNARSKESPFNFVPKSLYLVSFRR